MGLTLRLFRHAATDWTDERRYTGLADVGLNAAGITQLQHVKLPPGPYRSCVSSDLRRCLQTASLLRVKVRPEPLLREFDFGDLEGLTWDDLDEPMQQALLDYDGFAAPGGESVADFARRVEGFTESLADGLHLVVTHGGVIHHLLRGRGIEQHISPGEWVDLTLR